jgi:hypothetical protein
MKPRFGNIDDDDLVRRFRLTAQKLGELIITWMPAVRQTDILFAIKGALRERGGGARMKLAPLLDDGDRFVRYFAAKELFGLFPEQCRPIIEENTREFDALAGDARSFLRAIDEGFYKPE